MDGKILIVDDEKLTSETLKIVLNDQGFNDVWTVSNPFEAIDILENESIDVVVTDLKMPSMDGLTFLKLIQERWPDVATILMTAFGTVATAVEAMKQGAADYLTKPLNTEEFIIRLSRLVRRQRDIAEIRKLRDAPGARGEDEDFIYSSPAMAEIMKRVSQVADSEATILIEGETGTGKEVLAHAVHRRSGRSSGPFVAVNCAGLNPNLVESELFGHEAGSFTGAQRRRNGRLEYAFGGTLFIDEVDDLTPEIQVRLLRFLESRTFERVGGNQPIKANVRVICATKTPLQELVDGGKFRKDLFYRINTIILSLPPLRTRRQDIIQLAEYFAQRFRSARDCGTSANIRPETIRCLLQYDWPGNVREIEHVMEHAVTFARNNPILPEHLPSALHSSNRIPLVHVLLENLESVSFERVVAECERQLIDWALTKTKGNQAKAASLLHLSRTTFRSKHEALRSSDSSTGAEPDFQI